MTTTKKAKPARKHPRPYRPSESMGERPAMAPEPPTSPESALIEAAAAPAEAVLARAAPIVIVGEGGQLELPYVGPLSRQLALFA